MIDLNFQARDKLTLTDGTVTHQGGWKVGPGNKVIISYNANIYETHVFYYDKRLLLLQTEDTKQLIILEEQSVYASKELLTVTRVDRYLEQTVDVQCPKGMSIPLQDPAIVHQQMYQHDSATTMLENPAPHSEHKQTNEAKELDAILSAPSKSSTQQKKAKKKITFFDVCLWLILAFVIIVTAVAAYKAGWSGSIIFVIILFAGILAINSLFPNPQEAGASLVVSLLWLLYLFYEICCCAFG